MKKIQNLVNEPVFWLIVIQIMWFGGLFVASEVKADFVKLLLGGTWFFFSAFWILSKMNKWWSKYQKK